MSAAQSAIQNPQSAITRLPPSERDLEVYESVCIARHSLRSAAELHNLSVTRVRQLVKRVVNWLAETLPSETDASREKQLQLARHIAADQIQYAQCELMDRWRQTQDPSYLLKTTRLSLAAARLGVLPGTIDSLIAEAGETVEAAQGADTKAAADAAETPSEFCILNSEFPPSPPNAACAPHQKTAATSAQALLAALAAKFNLTKDLEPIVLAPSSRPAALSTDLRAIAPADSPSIDTRQAMDDDFYSCRPASV